MPNTTILLAGRAEEGKWFFDHFEETLKNYPEQVQVKVINADIFTLEETKLFFESLRNHWSKHDNKELVDLFKNLAQDEKRLKTLHLYTGGQPVRLSIYADLLYEGFTYPDPLQDSYEEALARTKMKPNLLEPTEPTPELVQAQQEIEQTFIDLLFRTTNQRAHVLQYLVRATRGLTVQQLHFLLHSQSGDDVFKWEETVKHNVEKQNQRETLLTLLQEMSQLSIVKVDPKEDGLAIYRLQDEIYRIYTEVLSHDETSQQAETEARQSLYNQLIQWIIPQQNRLHQERSSFLKMWLSQIHIDEPERIGSTTLPHRSPYEEKRSRETREKLLQLDLEFLHYNLLLDPYKHFNQTYFNIVYQKNIAEDIQVGNLFRSEVYRTLYEKFHEPFLKFDFPDPEPDDTQLETVRRIVDQYEAAHWILIFEMQSKPKRAIKLAEQIEQAIEGDKEKVEPHIYESWSGLLAQAERVCWRTYAQSGFAFRAVAQELEGFISKIKGLLKESQNQAKLTRLSFIVAEMYNTLGNCYNQLGLFQKAIHNFTEAEKTLRGVRDFKEQMAVSLNNKSRAIAEMGLNRAIRVCEDGLEIRLEGGEDLYALTLSYNTLGLIYNQLYQPKEALESCAKAYALAKQVSDPRVLGLVQIQLATALRRYPFFDLSIDRFARSHAIYLEANRLLDQAKSLFFSLNQGKPHLRLVETLITQACLYRDWLRVTEKSQTEYRGDYYERSKYLLMEAIEYADQLDLPRLKLQAMVHLAWTHYQMKHYDLAEQEVIQAEQFIHQISPTASFKPHQKPLSTSEEPDSFRPHYIFRQLSRIWHVRGRMAFEQFEQVQKSNPTYEEKKEQYLEKMAQAYAFATSYDEIFAPNTLALSRIYDDMYRSLKKINPEEMKIYYKYDQKYRKLYLLNELEPEDMGKISDFLLYSFGNYYPKEGDAIEDGPDEA